MHFDPVVAQLAFAIPICMGLVIYTLLRWERAALHGLLASLLGSTLIWQCGLALKMVGGSDGARLLGQHLEYAAVIFMPTLFVITMAYFARSALFEQSLAPSISLLAVSGVFLLGYLSDPQHHLFFADREAAMAGGRPETFAGPLFWATQLWVAAGDLIGIAYCGTLLARGPTRVERGRAAMILAAVVVPVAAHGLHLSGLLPLSFSLAPGSLALTGVFFVQGVHRYGLLGGQTIVRHDLIEHLDAGLVLANERGIVLDANASAEATLGHPRGELRGLAVTDVLLLLGTEESVRELGERIVALPLDGGRVEGAVQTADGRFIDVNGGALPAMASQPGGRFLSLQDRTSQRRSERLLRERQKLESVGILAAGVAHEVNNPLAFVRANLVQLEKLASGASGSEPGDALDDPAEAAELLLESIEGLDRIARIVESMLRFSRIPDEEHRLVDPGSIVDEAIRLAALQQGASVHSKGCDGALPRVMGSPERLIQVLLNLFLNAKHAAGDQAHARIEAEIRLEGAQLVLDVRDNGPGVPAELQERIFDPFFTTRGPGEGTGLGLSIAFDIVREHGGTLELHSPPGGGSCFSIRLPIAEGSDPVDD